MKKTKIFSLKPDDQRNDFKMMVTISKSNEETVVFVRFFDYNGSCVEKFYNKERTIGEVQDLVLQFLLNFRIIKNVLNWEYSRDYASKYENEDILKSEFGRDSAIYFAYQIKQHLLLNF